MKDSLSKVMEQDGPSVVLEIERTPHKVVTEPDATFSKDAMEALGKHMLLWVTTRLLRALQDGRPAQRMVVTVTVELDGEPAE